MSKFSTRLATQFTSAALLAVLAFSGVGPAVSASHTEASPIRIDALTVSATVSNHYAVTTVAETLTNPSDTAYQFTAMVAAPELAFVSRFALETGGHTYESRVEESAAARAAYTDGADQGSAAAIVESRDTHNFAVALNIPPRTTVVVHLSYEELILRVHGAYSYRFPLLATTDGRSVGALSLSGSVDGSATISSAESTHGTPAFPTPTSFNLASRASYERPAYDFGFTWTEAAPTGAGSFAVHGSNFVHTFSPEGAGLDANPLPKDIVFVIDTSGSMEDSLDQVKTVFSSIIADLRPADRFDVVSFSDGASLWAPALRDANVSNTVSARAWVNGFNAFGGTNLDYALGTGVDLIPVSTTRAPILIFLSDGEATEGTTRREAIRDDLLNHNLAHATVYTLAFGPRADYALMEALALTNNGEVRRIWQGTDAAEQIRGFYDGISTPVLRGLTVDYGEAVTDADRVATPNVFAGSEVVTVGTLAPGATSVTVTVSGQGANGPVSFTQTFDVTSSEAGAFVERAVAFERIRELERPAALGDLNARSEIVAIALAHSFVTPYTSLVVVVPTSLDPRGTAVQQPMLMTTASALTPHPSTPAGAYTGGAPNRATPGPGALLAGLALAGAALVAARRRTRR